MPTFITLALLLLLPAADALELPGETDRSGLVRITGLRAGTPVQGSGFVIWLDRPIGATRATILTASHVIEGVENLEVTFAADTTVSFSPDLPFGIEPNAPHGLAAFQVQGNLPAYVTAWRFEDRRKLHVGDGLTIPGFPAMSTQPLTISPQYGGPDGNLLQLDKAIDSGFSGSPVLWQLRPENPTAQQTIVEYRIVGVVTSVDQHVTFAINAQVAQGALEGWNVKLQEPKHSAKHPVKAPREAAKPVMDATCRPRVEREVSGIVFVYVCPGTFTMGSAEDDPMADTDEKPAHGATVGGFWISKYEITEKQFSGKPPESESLAELPATNVSWVEAKAACEAFGGRLPSEAEWEYAARAGSTTTWSFGDDEQLLQEYAWYGESYQASVHPVGKKKPNEWGLHDMYGNVWEWVEDDWSMSYDAAAQTPEPLQGMVRVARGGSFDMPASFSRSANRNWFVPEVELWNIGFRCVLDAGQPP